MHPGKGVGRTLTVTRPRVHPANLTQRGGSVLTIQEKEAFDAVVLGERAAGRWMAGSEGEVGAIEKIGQRYYMMFGVGGIMVTLVSDSPQGPFKAAKKNYRLLTGHTYFSRFFRVPDGVLVNHHSIARNGQV